MGPDHRGLFVGTVFLSHCVKSVASLFDEVSHHLWTEAEERQLLDDPINRLLELWRVTRVMKRGKSTKARDSPGGS